MIYLLHGKDGYRIRRRVAELRAERGLDDPLDANVVRLDPALLTPGELLANASAAPFLAGARLIIVDGLIATLTAERRGRGRKKDDDPLTPWLDAATKLADPAVVPATTTLILIEGAVDQRTQAFGAFSRIAQVEEFSPLAGAELADWIGRIAEEQGAHLAGRSTAAIAQMSGGDLWSIESELGKLAAYADGEVIEPQMLMELSHFAQETKTWDLTDAIVAGDESKALRSMQKLLDEGTPSQVLVFMITRQIRQIVITKDMRERGAAPAQIASAIGAPPFRVNALAGLASRYTWPVLRECYSVLIEADLAIKRGEAETEAALQLIVHELCARAPSGQRSAVRPRG